MSSQKKLVFRKRWLIVPMAVAVALAGAQLSTKLAQPEYQATCRLFVAITPSTTPGEPYPPGETYMAAQLARDRVIAYLDLIKGDRVAHAAIDSLRLDLPAPDLVQRIEATAEAESVLMNVSVTDSQSHRSADLANAVCAEFQTVAADAEGPNSIVNVKLVEKASAPQYPISPNLNRNLAVGALIGLLLGMALVLALERIWPERDPESEVVQPNGDIDNPATDDTGDNPATDDTGDNPATDGAWVSTDSHLSRWT